MENAQCQMQSFSDPRTGAVAGAIKNKTGYWKGIGSSFPFEYKKITTLSINITIKL